MGRIVVNKHTSDIEKINESSFTTGESREGEIIIYSNADNPAIYVHGPNDNEILKINDGSNVKLSSNYKKSEEEQPIVSSGDSFDVVAGKIVKVIDDLKGSVSRKAVDEIIIDNLSADYDSTGKTIDLKYVDASGITHILSQIDVTEFASQSQILKNVRIVLGAEAHIPQTPPEHQFLELCFIITGEEDKYVYQDITNMVALHVVLSETEYENLPESEKNNGKFYYTYED